MLQKTSQAFEHLLCNVCREAVTNPLCPFCLTKEVEAWLTMYPNLRSELMPKLHKHLSKIKAQIENTNICVTCENKKAAICPYCFTELIFNELKKMHVNKLVLKEFLQFFNFDFQHDGYYTEGEKLGVF